MSKLALRLFIFYSIIFTSQKIIDLFFGNLAFSLKILLIFILWTIVFGLYWHKLENKERHLADKCLVLLTAMLVIASAVSFLIHQIPVLVIGYIALSYLSFYPLIYLIIFLKRKPKFFKKIIMFSIILYSLISIGIVYDAFGGLTKTPIIGERLVALEKEQKSKIYGYRGEQRRGSFLMESSTIVFPVLSTSFLAISVLNTSSLDKKRNIFSISLITSTVIWLACFFSLSRTPLFLISAMIFCFFAKIAGIGTTKKLLRQIGFVTFIVTLLIASTQVQSYLYNQIDSSAVDAFNSGISSEDIANKKRFQAWGRGLELFTEESEAWLGNGLGTSRVGLEKYLGSKAEYHYESSLLSSLSEAGIIGIFIEILPLLVVIYVVIYKRANNIFIVWALLFLVNLFAAPITAYSTMFARYLGMGLCIASTIPERPKYKQLQQVEMIYYQ